MTLPRIEIVGLGPAGPDLITAGTRALLDEVEVRRLRTSRHPAAAGVDAPTFDFHYESAGAFAEVYDAIVTDLVELARAHERVLYAVPGSPAVAERTVEMLATRGDVDVRVHAALSFADLAWVALGVDPIAHGVRIIDGHRFGTEAAGSRGPLLVSQCHDRQILSDIKLAVDPPDDLGVVVLQRLGLADERISTVRWHELDRLVDPDHLTSLYIAELPTPIGTAFARFGVLVDRLRSDCPWDADQTHASLRRYLIEESYETLEAIDQLVGAEPSDPDIEQRYADLAEELGDLLFQVFFHAKLADEQGWFDVASVATGIHDKLHERHPHVFGDNQIDAETVGAQWEASKKSEKQRDSVMDGIPAALPALLYSAKVQKKAAAIGLDPVEVGEALARATPASGEADVAERLFALVSEAKEMGIDAESALRQWAVAFADRVRTIEATPKLD